MAEIAIISQDFCTLQELQSQRESAKIEFKSIPPWVQAQYSLGPYTTDMPSYSYSYGFMRKVSENETRVGNLKITRNTNFTRGGNVSYASAFLDMDNNRIINLGDADMGGPGTPAGTPHHATNLRVGDQRYLRKESWSTDDNRTMMADLIFGTDLTIKRSINTGKLTITAGNSSSNDRAALILNSGTAQVNILAKTGTINLDTNLFVQNSVNEIRMLTNNLNLNGTIVTNINSPEVNIDGDVTLNAGITILGGDPIPVNDQKRLKNLRRFDYSEVGRGTTQYDRDAITVGDFKAHQRGENLGSTVSTYGGSGVGNVYIGQDQGVHQFRRILGGTNIRVDQVGNDIVINNTMGLAITLDVTAFGNPPNESLIVNRLVAMFPPANFSVNTILNVTRETPSVSGVTSIVVNVSDTRRVTYTQNIGRGITNVGLVGSVTATAYVPDASQPRYSCTSTVVSYKNTGTTWQRL